MDTLSQFVAAFEKSYEDIAGTTADPYKDVPEFDDIYFPDADDAWAYDEQYA